MAKRKLEETRCDVIHRGLVTRIRKLPKWKNICCLGERHRIWRYLGISHTYIHYWSLFLYFCQEYKFSAQITYVGCANFIP